MSLENTKKTLEIIPVIDLLDGQVVHARRGDRQHYQPIQSSLCNGSEPLTILQALLELYPFDQLYIADLNAIQKRSESYHSNYQIIESIIHHFPNLKLWVDAGIGCNLELSLWSKLHSKLVFGSENFSGIENFLTLKHNIKTQFVLSLDFMPNGYQGPIELLESTKYWPQDVIVMSLPNVGTNQGINTELMNEIAKRSAGFNLYAAGGIRGIDDLTLLKKMGVHGALIATALHQKQLSYQQLASLE
jgi:phosphoribosylformimino-5-aminoimidazole carboxamide ribotide isomerase